MRKSLALPVIEARVTGYVIYHGPSLINGEKIVVIATGVSGNKSDNEKTGAVIQCWILHAGLEPLAANHKGLDESVCSSCKHRHFRSCYVNFARGPEQVYQTWKDGKYPVLDMDNPRTPEIFRDKIIRLGAFGDPVAVPVEVWDTITQRCISHLGYTHQWKQKRNNVYKKYCMASCDTLGEVYKAKFRRWRPFYVRQEGEALPPGFFECPASKAAGKRLTCAECKACAGGTHCWGQASPSIVVHGPSWKTVFFKRGMKLLTNKEKYVGVFAKAE